MFLAIVKSGTGDLGRIGNGNVDSRDFGPGIEAVGRMRIKLAEASEIRGIKKVIDVLVRENVFETGISIRGSFSTGCSSDMPSWKNFGNICIKVYIIINRIKY